MKLEKQPPLKPIYPLYEYPEEQIIIAYLNKVQSFRAEYAPMPKPYWLITFIKEPIKESAIHYVVLIQETAKTLLNIMTGLNLPRGEMLREVAENWCEQKFENPERIWEYATDASKEWRNNGSK